MESFSIDVASLEGKEDQQMILVQADDLNDSNKIEDSIDSPLVHHVLENLSFTTKHSDEFHCPQCLICNAKLGVSGRGSMDIFSKQIKTTSRHLDLDIVLGSILNQEISAGRIHSSIVCKKCFKMVDDIDAVEGQLFNMKQEVANKYGRTMALLRHESNSNALGEDNFDAEEIQALSKDDKEFKIYTSNNRGRHKRKKKQRGRPSFIKLEVKEECMDNALHTLELSDPSQLLQDSFMDSATSLVEMNERTTFFTNEENGEVRFDLQDVFVVDGLDLNCSRDAHQIGDVVLSTLSAEDPEEGFMQNEIAAENSFKFKCRYCSIQMQRFSQVEKHILTNHADRLTECEVCELKSPNRTLFLEHIEQHIASELKPYACTLCLRRYPLPRQLRQHLRHHLRKSVQCYRCPKRFRSPSSLREHLTSHTVVSNKSYGCERCSKRFASKHNLKTHLKTHGGVARARPHQCKTCQKHFLTSHHLQEHEIIHLNRKDFVCESCGKAFNTQRSLLLHSITHSGVKNYSCRICHKAFARKGEVEDHERIHTGEKPFQCEICGATFCQRSNLLSHKKATHFEEKKYHCTDCPKAFKRRRLLVYHVMSVHTGERPYKCDFCSAAFVYPEHYKKHMRIHTGEKPFKCEICGKAFNSRDNKNAHKFIHSDKKQYECTLCGAGFMRKPLLCSHIAQHDHQGGGNVDNYIKVNSASVVDAELLENGANSSELMKLDDDVELVRNPDAELMTTRPIQLIEPDDIPKYILHTDRNDEENVGHFLASLQGQVVEVRAEDLERYTELTPDQISQMAQVAAQVVATQSSGTSNDEIKPETFHIQVEEEKDKSVATAIMNQRDSNSSSPPRQSNNAFSYKKVQMNHHSSSPSVRHVRLWHQ